MNKIYRSLTLVVRWWNFSMCLMALAHHYIGVDERYK